jgi:hypothetical protein
MLDNKIIDVLLNEKCNKHTSDMHYSCLYMRPNGTDTENFNSLIKVTRT